MSCPYCTPRIDEDTGESTEFCQKQWYHVDHDHFDTLAQIHLVQDKDDASWSTVVLMADKWPERVDVSHFPLVTCIPGPKFCPECGRRLTCE